MATMRREARLTRTVFGTPWGTFTEGLPVMVDGETLPGVLDCVMASVESDLGLHEMRCLIPADAVHILGEPRVVDPQITVPGSVLAGAYLSAPIDIQRQVEGCVRRGTLDRAVARFDRMDGAA